MQLTVIIVNYNVKAFLEQCLYSVFKASKHLNSEIFVVDNNSVDGSVEMVESFFPAVKLIKNAENKGFAFACNQAIKKSKGEQIAEYQQQIQKINQILNSRKALLEHKVTMITGEIDLMTRKVREQERRREREELDRRFKESYFDTHESEIPSSNLLPPDVEEEN